MAKKPDTTKRQIFFREESVQNPFREEVVKRAGWGRNRTTVILAIVLAAVMLAAVIFRYDFLHNPVTAARYASAVSERMTDLWRLISGHGDWNGTLYSLCTVVIVAIVGAWLSSCGSVYQGLFHTPMASPSMLGVSSGGMLGAVCYLWFFWTSSSVDEVYTYQEYRSYLDTLSFYQMYSQQLWMLGGCIAGGAIVIFLSGRAGRGRFSSVVLILAGSLLGSFANTITSLAQYYFTYVDSSTDRMYAMMTISMGTFANAYSPKHLLMIGIPVLLCMTVLFRLTPGLNLLMFGDEEAMAAGMNVRRFRTLVFLLCIIPCAVILSFCGQISFIGLIVPHFARQIAGSDYRWNLPASALLGAISMVLVYMIAVCTGYTTSINLITSLTGGSLALGFILRYRRQRNADWA